MSALDRLKIVTLDRVLQLIPVSRMTIHRMVQRGDFPAPVKLGGTNVWLEGDLEDWLAERFPAATSKTNRRNDFI